MAQRFIGLMSGTSLDGVDGVLADFSHGEPRVAAHAARPFPPELRAELLALNGPGGTDELHRAAFAAQALVRVYAAVVADLLAATGLSAADVQAIGAHGQTVRHRPELGYTLQLNAPALLAELAGIDVVANFRSRDVAAGGQGAPLVPAFHARLFARPDEAVAVLNLGGISNLTVLGPCPAGGEPDVLGFDCGPGNALMDHWCQQHTGQPFDADGAWAATGQVLPALLAALLAEPFLALPPPKSTGRDLFNPAWLAGPLAHAAGAAPADVQATLTEFTAVVCADHLRRYGAAARSLLVCGGGALNGQLMAGLRRHLPGVAVDTTASRGLPPLQVEATAFAWLARQAVLRLPGNLVRVTGAAGPRILGAIYPA